MTIGNRNKISDGLFSIFQAKEAEQEMLRLEHAKLVAKMEKRREENRVIKVDGPPPPPPGANLPNLPKL